jgi:hypothetical protein
MLKIRFGLVQNSEAEVRFGLSADCDTIIWSSSEVSFFEAPYFKTHTLQFVRLHTASSFPFCLPFRWLSVHISASLFAEIISSLGKFL